MIDQPASGQDPGTGASTSAPAVRNAAELAVLAELGREVTSVLDLDHLLQKIPLLIARLASFTVFSVYLLDEQRQDLHIAYAVGYPDDVVDNLRLQLGQGVVGTAVAEQRAILLDDVAAEPRYLALVPGVKSQLAVPLRHKGKVIGALNLLSDKTAAFTERDEVILRQFAAHVAQAIVNARLFESEREYADTLETLAEIGREMSAILDLNELLTRLAHLVKRLVDYRTFGVALLDEPTQTLEMKVAIKYGDEVDALAAVKVGQGLVGTAALTREVVLVNDVTQDSRYIAAVKDVRSELVVPMLLKDRVIGVFDLESPELNAFSKKHVELLTLLASQAAVAIENARLYEAIRNNELRLDREVRLAQRVQLALLPQDLPKRLRGADVAWHFDPARELGGDVFDFLSPEANTLVVSVGDVSGKGVPAALYSASVGEVVRGRTFRRRLETRQSSPATMLTALNRILYDRGLEEYYCTLCYAMFDFKQKRVTLSNSGLPYPVRCAGGRAELIPLPGVPLGSFGSSTYDEVAFDLAPDDVYVFCSDGISETFSEAGDEFGAARLKAIVEANCQRTAKEIVGEIFRMVQQFRGDAPQTDDQTAVVVKIAPGSSKLKSTAHSSP
jgi:sigma-B regulation protein RsbU (phosphoserine phosphatase)